LTRSELKAQDEITTTIQNFTEIAYARKKELITGAAVLLVLALAFLGWRYYSASRNAAAQAQLGEVIDIFRDSAITVEKEKFEKTAAAAQKTIDSYGSSPAGTIARYYLALSQDGLGNTADAVKNLQQVIDGGDAEHKPVAQFALAQIHSRHGEFQKAIDVLKQLEQSGGFSKSAVLYELGSASEAGGQLEQARTYYSKVVTDFPDSSFREASEVALKRRGFPIPAPTPATLPTPPSP
jgi:predicted negative regulator of RcsB-dependent stress response